MAFSFQSFKRHSVQQPVGKTDGTPNLNQVSRFNYATEDAAAVVEAAGYFNAARGLITVGSTVSCVMAMASGTPVLKSYVFLTVPATGNVTIGLATGTLG